MVPPRKAHVFKEKNRRRFEMDAYHIIVAVLAVVVIVAFVWRSRGGGKGKKKVEVVS